MLQVESGAAVPRLWSTGSVVVGQGLSCSTTCGIFLQQRSYLCPLHRQADSLPLSHPGSPRGWGVGILGRQTNLCKGTEEKAESQLGAAEGWIYEGEVQRCSRGEGLQPKSTVPSSLDLTVDREHLAASHPEPEIFTLRERERERVGR